MTDGKGPVAQTSKGSVRGSSADGVNSFKGVPFAKPPVGDLRFKPAQPAEPWDGELDATSYGYAPVQGSNPTVEHPTSEDCLTLNVFAPDSPGPHPVFVWIFGGNNNFGEGGSSLYDGTAFARDGVILVAINYRVSALGWLNLEHLLGPEYEGSANAGISDMVAGIRWVHEEIEAFGGDPDRITVGGESVGAKNTMAMLATDDDVRGMIRSVILESGTCQFAWSADVTKVMADAYLEELGLTPETADQLLTMDPQKLVEAFSPSMEQPDIAGFNVRATIDGKLIKSTGLQAAREGLLNGMRVLIGNNHDEYQLFEPQGPLTRDPGIEQMDYVSRPKMAAEINDRYRKLRPDLSDHDRWFRIMCDEEWWMQNVRFVEALEENGKDNDVWMYRFDFDPVKSPAKLGPCHTMELAFVFDTLDSAMGQNMVGDSPGAQKMADRMHAAWVKFIKGEAPGGGEIPEWPRYELKGREVMIFDNDCRIERDPWSDLREAWTGIQ